MYLEPHGEILLLTIAPPETAVMSRLRTSRISKTGIPPLPAQHTLGLAKQRTTIP